MFSEVAPILLGRVGDGPLDVVGEAGNDGTPGKDEDTVGHVPAPDDDEDVHDDETHEQREIGAEIVGVDGQIKFGTATAEFIEVRLAPLGLCGTTLATWPSVILSVDVCPSLPIFSANALDLLWDCFDGRVTKVLP